MSKDVDESLERANSEKTTKGITDEATAVIAEAQNIASDIEKTTSENKYGTLFLIAIGYYLYKKKVL